MSKQEFDIDKARNFCREVQRLGKKYKMSYFFVTDGAFCVSNNGNPAVRHARECVMKNGNEKINLTLMRIGVILKYNQRLFSDYIFIYV